MNSIGSAVTWARQPILPSKKNYEKNTKRCRRVHRSSPTGPRGKPVQLRKIIKAAAPKADEGISYKVPYYKYQGALVYFAAFKNHIGLFVPPPIIEEHKLELKGYETAKAKLEIVPSAPVLAYTSFRSDRQGEWGANSACRAQTQFRFGCFQADTAKLICDFRFLLCGLRQKQAPDQNGAKNPENCREHNVRKIMRADVHARETDQDRDEQTSEASSTVREK